MVRDGQRGNPELTALLCSMDLADVSAYCSQVLESRLQDVTPAVQRIFDAWDAGVSPPVDRRLLSKVQAYLEGRTDA